VEELRHAHVYAPARLDEGLAKVFDAVEHGTFGKAGEFSALLEAIVDHGDYYLVSDDFTSYCKTQELIDESFRNRDEWVTKCITSVARMGFFSSDRCIEEYSDMIWNIEPLEPAREDGLVEG
jgi:glycogen phosphorylase